MKPNPAAIDVAFVTELERDVPPDAMHVLTRSALLAVKHYLVDEAEVLSAGLKVFEPYYSAVTMAQATVAAATNRRHEALELLERLIVEEPDLHSAACACATLRKEMGLPGWRTLAQRVVDRAGSDDPHSAEYARVLLDLPATAPAGAARLPGASADQAGLRFA